MDQDKVLVKKLMPKYPIFELQFEYSNFRKIKTNEEVSAYINNPEIDAVCSVDFKAAVSRMNLYFSECKVSVEGLSEEFQTPDKYQIRILAKIKELTIVDSEFVNITSEIVSKQNAIYNREVCDRISPSGSIFLDVSVTLKLLQVSSACNLLHLPMKMYKQIANNSQMLNDPQFSDFKFVVKGKEFKVHRNILAAASSVFEKLFTADMQETRTNECIVKDIEPEIFERLLRFVYGGNLPDNIAAVSVKLFEAAHFYDIKQLKEICQKKLPSFLKIENALELFKWSCVYDEENLKMKAWKIIKRDILKIFLPMKNEPPTPQLIEEMIQQKQQEQAFWEKII